MPETVADPPARSCYSLISKTGSGEYQWVGPDLFGLARARGMPARVVPGTAKRPRLGSAFYLVAGRVPATHVFRLQASKTWVPGTRPGTGFDLIGRRLPWGDRRRLPVDMPAGRCARDARPGGFSRWCPSTDRGSPGRSARETR